MMRRVAAALVVVGLVGACAGAAGGPARGAPQFAVSSGAGDEVAVGVEGERVMIDVRSQRGIGSAQVELVSGSAPEWVVVRLHLVGLEELRVSNGETTMRVEVASGDAQEARQSVITADGQERAIARGSTEWMAVRVVADGHAPRIPLENGYFEVTLPRNFVTAGRRVVTLRWVDLFR